MNATDTATQRGRPTVWMPGKSNPRERPSTPAEIVAAAHAAAPLVWRKHVGVDRRSNAAQAVRGALNLTRHRALDAIRRRNSRPVFSDAESDLLRAAEIQHRRMVWVHFFFRPREPDAARRARCKEDTVTALEIIDALVAAEKTAAGDTPHNPQPRESK